LRFLDKLLERTTT
jgi:SWI/SNF-related matrix-associated actin-dependent regulator of chromatin subfamily A member 5